MILLKILICLLLFPFVYSFGLYPIILFILGTLKKSHQVIQGDCENIYSVSFLLPAYNEALHIEKKLENLQALQNPGMKIQILVGNDGSIDETRKIIEAWAKRYPEIDLVLVNHDKNRGKWVMLKKLRALAQGDLIIFSDISAILPINFLSKLKTIFAHSEVAVYAPTYGFHEVARKKIWEKLYWPVEKFIRHYESKWFSTIGAHGACYVVRATHLISLEELEVNGLAPLNDDFLIPTLSAASHKKKIFYDIETPILERDTPSAKVEYKRRLRIAQGNFKMGHFLRRRLPFGKYPKYYFLFFSHKIIRSYIGPLSFAGAVIFSCLSWGDLRYNCLGLLFVLGFLGFSPFRASLQAFYFASKDNTW